MLIHVLGSQDSDQAFVQTSLLFGRGMWVLRFIVSKIMNESRIMQSRIFEGFACPYFPTFMRFMHVLAVVEQLSCSSASDSPYHSQELFCGTSRSLVSSVLQRPLGVEFGRYKVYIVHICTLCRFRIRFIHFCQAGAAISLALLDQFFFSRAGVATIPLGL